MRLLLAVIPIALAGCFPTGSDIARERAREAQAEARENREREFLEKEAERAELMDLARKEREARITAEAEERRLKSKLREIESEPAIRSKITRLKDDLKDKERLRDDARKAYTGFQRKHGWLPTSEDSSAWQELEVRATFDRESANRLVLAMRAKTLNRAVQNAMMMAVSVSVDIDRLEERLNHIQQYKKELGQEE